MRRLLPGAGRRRRSLIRRLDAAAAWVNPFLMVIAVILLLADLSCGVALVVARLPVTYVGEHSSAAGDGPSGGRLTAGEPSMYQKAK